MLPQYDVPTVASGTTTSIVPFDVMMSVTKDDMIYGTYDSIVEYKVATVTPNEDGTVVATGNSAGTSASALLVTGWTDIIDIACTAKASFGLKSNGTVILAGDSNYFTTYQTWTGIKAIFVNNYGLIGIKEDGTLVSDGLNSNHDLTVDGIVIV